MHRHKSFVIAVILQATVQFRHCQIFSNLKTLSANVSPSSPISLTVKHFISSLVSDPGSAQFQCMTYDFAVAQSAFKADALLWPLHASVNTTAIYCTSVPYIGRFVSFYQKQIKVDVGLLARMELKGTFEMPAPNIIRLYIATCGMYPSFLWCAVTRSHLVQHFDQSFGDPGQAELVHLNCKLEDVVQTVYDISFSCVGFMDSRRPTSRTESLPEQHPCPKRS